MMRCDGSVADEKTVQERLTQIEGHLTDGTGAKGQKGDKARKALLEKRPDDVSLR